AVPPAGPCRPPARSSSSPPGGGSLGGSWPAPPGTGRCWAPRPRSPARCRCPRAGTGGTRAGPGGSSRTERGPRPPGRAGAAASPPPSAREPPPATPLRASPAALGEPRPEHFDRLIRQSKLWCYAKGFNLDGKGLRHGTESPAALRGRQDGNAKRRRLARVTERQRASPPRNSFSLMGNFPCTPSLVVGEDGDLCPASSLGGKNSWALSKTHPLWRWHLGGSAIPVPPSLKFRGCASLEDP
uniref:Uncharacterized protein n=1 Tax=Geospiza parvula TaxID=87175 RepID=A0A8C3QBL1_GEOPR